MPEKELKEFKIPKENIKTIVRLMDKTAPGQYGHRSAEAAYDLWTYIGTLYPPVLEEGAKFSIDQRGIEHVYIVETKEEKTNE